MAISNYLDSILKVMPAIQAKQISNLLNKLRVSGEIRNPEEYSAKLQELSTLINDRNPIPSFNQILAGIWYTCESAAHNAMMEALKNDLEALFLQVDEIGNKVNDHHFLFMKNLIADLEKGLSDQENKINRLEWLAGQNNEFSLVLANSFMSASLFRISRSDSIANSLYFDNRTYANKTEEQLPNAVVDEIGEKLLLGTVNDSVIYPISVRQLNDSYSYGTVEDVDINNDITNIIDGISDTYWTRNVYLNSQVPKVTTILDFNLGSATDINYIVVQSASPEEFIIEDIIGVKPDGNKISLIDSQYKVSGKTRIDFDRVFVKSFQVTFAVYSYNKIEYFIPEDYKLNEIFIPYSSYKKTARTISSQFEGTYNNSYSTDSKTLSVLAPNKKFDKLDILNSLGPAIRSVLSSDKLSDVLNVAESEDNRQINSYSYSFALDNVWAGNSKYIDDGIFVSKPLSAENIGLLAISSSENVTTTSDVSNSIEYQIIKTDRYPFFKEVNFPIPYLNQTNVTSERLILTKKEDRSDIEDAGQLRFCPYVPVDWDIIDPLPITVYENGKELRLGSDYEYAINTIVSAGGQSVLNWEGTSYVNASDFDNYKLSIPKMWIKILRPNSGSVYTVDYEIRTSDSYTSDKNLYLDKDKTIFLSHNGRVNFRRDNLDATIKSDIYLQITLRRNTATQSKSPELLEYAILGSTYR